MLNGTKSSKHIKNVEGRRRQPRSSFAIDHSRPIIGDAKDSRETARWIFLVLIGSEVYSIVTYLLSENLDDGNSDCCANASAVVTKIYSE